MMLKSWAEVEMGHDRGIRKYVCCNDFSAIFLDKVFGPIYCILCCNDFTTVSLYENKVKKNSESGFRVPLPGSTGGGS